MKSKKSLTEKELEEWKNSRDLSAELLESVRQIRVVMSPMISTLKKSGLSQAEFANLLDVLVHTLKNEWEQGRCKPSGAAKILIAIAKRHPDVLKCTSSHLSTYEFFS